MDANAAAVAVAAAAVAAAAAATAAAATAAAAVAAAAVAVVAAPTRGIIAIAVARAVGSVIRECGLPAAVVGRRRGRVITPGVLRQRGRSRARPRGQRRAKSERPERPRPQEPPPRGLCGRREERRRLHADGPEFDLSTLIAMFEILARDRAHFVSCRDGPS